MPPTTVEITVRNSLTKNVSKLSSAVQTLEKHVIRQAEARLANGQDPAAVRRWAQLELQRYMSSFNSQASVKLVG